LLIAAENSLVVYFLSLVIGTPLGLFFSYYIYKKMPGSSAFRVLLFMPSIVSGIVMVAMFQFFVEQAVPQLWKDVFGIEIRGLIENPDTRFGTILFFCIWSGFGTSVLMYSNAMSGISQEIVESAHLDGATGIREFISITFPMIFPTLSTFLITGVAGIFTNQFALYSFYGGGASPEIQTYGYYMYMKTKNATSEAEYPILSAMGLWMTVVAVPLTLVVKWLLEKFGPSED
jgi:ABC-type sugar transport system permease subunit